jgi:LuxR family maltose regulon positive regulatory protein
MFGDDATAPRDGTGDQGAAGGRDHRADLFGAKVRPPYRRPGLVSRGALVQRMLARREEPLIAVVAPPGYGKTTLLAEWSAHHDHDVAWISIDEDDNDPSILLSAAASSLSGAGRLDPHVVEEVQARTTSIPRALSTLTSAIARTPSMVVVLDNVESVTNPAALDVMVALALHLPIGSQLAYASRAPLPLPAPLLRSQGAVLEIGIEDLAMDRGEAQQLLANVGVSLSHDEIDDVYVRTEGWPAGLYLAALASKGRRQATTSAFAFRGDDVFMADYLRTEFLTRTSLLEQLCGPLCDVVLAAPGSQTTLEQLESSNLLLVPLDRHRGWYRYHGLFRDLLAAELARREPELVPVLHRRAAEWLEQHRLPEEAIHHAQRSGDPELVVRLTAKAITPSFAAGHVDTVLGWLEWFRVEGLIERHRDLAVLGATVDALSGHAASAERWAAAAEGDRSAPRSDDDPPEGPLAYLRCLLCRDGTAQMRDDARQAQALLAADDGLRPGAMLFEGLSHLLDDEPALADPVLAHAYDVSSYAGAMPTAVAAAAGRSLAAIARDDWAEAEVLAACAVEIVERGHLEDYSTAGLAHAAAARTALHRDDREAASEHLTRCMRLRHLFTYAIPATAIIQLEMVRAYLQLADPTGARTVLRELRDLLHQRPDLGAVPAQADELQRQLDAVRQGPAGASSLTAAELRLLPYLATHLSFPEIGQRLHVSRHTVKSQAIAIYRKLGATSRSDAIERARQIGLMQ